MDSLIQNENSLKNIRLALSLISSVINETNPKEPDFEPDWEFIYKFTKAHNVDNTIFYAVERLNNKPSTELYKKWMNNRNKCIHRTMIQQREFASICSAFEEQDIEYMPIKGFLVSGLYPKEDMRYMSDLDILIKDAQKAGSAVTELGYYAERVNFMYDDSYLKPPFMHLELHRELFRIHSEFYEYYKNAFEKAQKSGLRYDMTLEDSYVYITAHLYKHYCESGTGIRSIADIFLLNQKLLPKLNNDYFFEELKKLGIKEFYDEISALADKWFKSEDYREFKDEELYILGSGTYGKTNNKILNRHKELGEKHFYLKRIFPPLSYMKDIFYPVRKCPVLLPFFYLYRIIRLISPKYRKKVQYELKVLNDEKG